MFRFLFTLIVVVALCGLVLLAVPAGRMGQGLGSAPASCPVGFGGLETPFGDFFEEEPPSPEVAALLEDPDFGASYEAEGDLRDGIVDPRLVNSLLLITDEHKVCVDAFKEGHSFLPGVEDRPTIPEGYGKAGGLPNTHYYGRAADIWYVDGKPIEGNGTDRDVLGVGRTLAGMPPEERPDQIIGPPDWTQRLDRSWQEGWVLSQDQLRLHDDHIHIGYNRENGNKNRR